MPAFLLGIRKAFVRRRQAEAFDFKKFLFECASISREALLLPALPLASL